MNNLKYYRSFQAPLELLDRCEEPRFTTHRCVTPRIGRFAYLWESYSALRYAMGLFILSEIMFFFSLFWSYFYFTSSPSIQIGIVWPSYGITLANMVNPLGQPLVNTCLLLASGATVTYAHAFFNESLNVSFWKNSVALLQQQLAGFLALFATIALGTLFLISQLQEFILAPLAMNDSIYGTNFYMLTGFHGLHVLVGTLLLAIIAARSAWQTLAGNEPLHHDVSAMDNQYFNKKIFLDVTVWYWHFVDVVWLILFSIIYLPLLCL